MKITKTFNSVFLFTFLIGILGYFLVSERETYLEKREAVQTVTQEVSQSVSDAKEKGVSKTEIELEIIEENNAWDNEDESKFEIKLQEIGQGFHGDQVEAKSGETWLGLFKDKKDFYLKKSKVKIRRVHDSIVDAEETQKTGKSVSVLGKKQPIYLLKNANFLKEGKVETLFGGNPKSNDFEDGVDYLSLRVGFSREFNLGNQKYSIKVKKGKNKKDEIIFALILENGKTSQVLHSLKYFGGDDYAGTLYWVGDLDHDGNLDILTELYFHDNVMYRNLYLSSKARSGKLVEKVAVFSTTGC